MMALLNIPASGAAATASILSGDLQQRRSTGGHESLHFSDLTSRLSFCTLVNPSCPPLLRQFNVHPTSLPILVLWHLIVVVPPRIIMAVTISIVMSFAASELSPWNVIPNECHS